ncbi:MAG: aspartate kinase [Acidobacteria bacterium]|nr:aspartate kinase [Acidobacteriota bacterium]MCB9397568.1 aspartate kinase [Acidobacteriota bacterium]
MKRPIVHKFGGTSVRDAERLRLVVANIAQSRREYANPTVIITSAAAGVTDQLVGLRPDTWLETTRLLRSRHLQIANELGLSEKWKADYAAHFDRLLGECPVGLENYDPATLASIHGCGERLMAPLLAEALVQAGFQAEYIDSAPLIRTDNHYLSAAVDLATSKTQIAAALNSILSDRIPVLAGFIGSNAEGHTTLLGRNGSDYSASIFGAGTDAFEVWIWTDVDGIYTADPRHHQHSKLLREISFRESAEAAYFGAKVVHPYTMWPLLESDTNLRIKNTMSPEKPGTLICHEPQDRGPDLITTAIKGVAIVTVGGYGLIGVPGVASRVFGVISSSGTNVLMISQSSSEHNISFAIRGEDLAITLQALNHQLQDWMEREHRIDRIKVVENAAILTVVGENMRGRVGVAGTIFSALGEAGINVIAIAQGSSEYSISIVVDEAQVFRATDAILEKAGSK